MEKKVHVREQKAKQGSAVLPVCRMEFEKLYRMPVFYGLVLMCIAFNVFLFWDGKGNQTEFIQDMVNERNEHTEEFEKDFFYDHYVDLDLKQIAEYAKWEKQFDDLTESLLRANYEKLRVRAEEMQETEKNSVTFTGECGLHSFLFGDYWKYLIGEGALLILVTVLYLMHYEEYQHTEELVAASRIGTGLYRVKLFVSGGFALFLTAFVMLVSLGIYFLKIDNSSVWDCFVSSNYNTERRTVNGLYLVVYPYITWSPMAIRQYFLSVSGITLLLFLFMILFAGLVAGHWKNSITALSVVVIYFMVLYFLGNEIVIPNWLEYIVQCNPVHLVMKCGYWFMDYAPGDTYPFYELFTVLVWNGLAAAGWRRNVRGLILPQQRI